MKKPLSTTAFSSSTFYLYINADGSEYETTTERFVEIADEDLPEDVYEFNFTLRPLPAKYAINAARATAEMVMKVQLSGDDIVAGEHSVNEIVNALVEWNLTDEDGNSVNITKETIQQLTPGWLYGAIDECNTKVNTLSKK